VLASSCCYPRYDAAGSPTLRVRRRFRKTTAGTSTGKARAVTASPSAGRASTGEKFNAPLTGSAPQGAYAVDTHGYDVGKEAAVAVHCHRHVGPANSRLGHGGMVAEPRPCQGRPSRRELVGGHRTLWVPR
jgi:hypothetical protein